MNQCARTFVLVGMVTAILLALHQLPPLSIGGKELRDVNILSDLVPEPSEGKPVEDTVPAPELPEPRMALTADSAKDCEAAPAPPGVTAIVDYSDGKPGGMEHFYKALAGIDALDRPVRIAYYGDSFIEGDILTGDLRERLQQRFGGNGVGWVDCGSKTSGFRNTIVHKFSGLEEHDVTDEAFSHKHEGISQRYFIPSEGATISFAAAKRKPHAASWSVANLFLRTGTPLDIQVGVDDKPETAFRVEASPTVQCIAVADTMRKVTYRLENVGRETYAYGAALESGEGVILDNLSIRGSAGYSLADMPPSTLRDFSRLRPYDLIVIHYGLNVLNDQSSAVNYKAWAARMERAIANLREANPDASILIMSVPDRCQRTADGIRTMEGVEALVAYQQILASTCGVAFFNLFNAMGGKESMKELVDKGWANKDYTHLNFTGGYHLSEYIYDSFMAGYDAYMQMNTHQE